MPQKFLSLYFFKTELMICPRDWQTMAKSCPPPDLINSILLVHHHTRPFTFYLRLILHDHGRKAQWWMHVLQNLSYLLSDPLQKILADSDPKETKDKALVHGSLICQ